MKRPLLLGLFAILTVLVGGCGDTLPPTESVAISTTSIPSATWTAIAGLAPEPYYGPYCSKLDREFYLAASDVEKKKITDEIGRVRDSNREILWSHPAVYSTGIGFVPVSGGGEAIGIKVGFVKAELTPGEPRPEDVIPDTIGCVKVELEAGGRPCTLELIVIGAKVVDDQSGGAITGAYWRSKTEGGSVLVELKEGRDHTRYVIADDNLLEEAAEKEGKASATVHEITVIADKDGYQRAESSLRVTTDRCGHIQDVEGDTVTRLVRDGATPRPIVRAPPKPQGAAGRMVSTAQRLWLHAAARLQDGRFLVVGGGIGQSMADTQMYDPQTGMWSSRSSMGQAHHRATATLLTDGRVLVAGGVDRVINIQSAEIYDMSTDTWSPAADMAEGRSRHTATLLQDGGVLVLARIHRRTRMDGVRTAEGGG